MHTSLLRARTLAALGLSSSMLSACSSTEPGGTTPTTTTEVTVATSEPTASATATSTVATVETSAPTATATAAGSVAFWQPTVLPPPPPGRTGPPDPGLHMPSCPSGEFCVSEAHATGSTMAAAPFDKCAVQVGDPQSPSSMGRSIHLDLEQTKRERTKTKDACCYDWVIPCPGGRPLMVDGAARVTQPARSDAWLGQGAQRSLADVLAALAADDRAALGDHYATEAAYEHASVAAFARVSLQLLAVGAPADLVADTHRAALDEIRHAEAMYRLASAYRGHGVGPGPLSLDGASLSASIVELAAEAFVEGCVGEVAAALVLREEAARAADHETREVLEATAGDEERHAELAWRTVGWALTQAPETIRAMLEQRREELEAELVAELPAEGRTLPSVTSARERMAIRRQAIREVVMPCLTALLAHGIA